MNVRTYIASGNVVFETTLGETRIKALLEARLASHAGSMIEVLVRTADAMAAA